MYLLNTEQFEGCCLAGWLALLFLKKKTKKNRKKSKKLKLKVAVANLPAGPPINLVESTAPLA